MGTVEIARVFLDPSIRSAKSQLTDAIAGGAREILFVAGAGTTAFDASVISLVASAKASRVEVVALEADSLPALSGSAGTLGRAGITVTRLRVRRPGDVAAARDVFAAFAGE